MIVGKKYKIKDSECFDRYNLEPYGTIVKCVEDQGNNWYAVTLINACGRQIREGISGWLINTTTTYYDEI